MKGENVGIIPTKILEEAKNFKVPEPQVDFADKKPSIYSFEEGVEILKQRKEEFYKGAVEQENAEVKIETNLPFLVVPTGDWHFPSVYCDIDRLTHDLDEIEQRPNAALILMSNLVDSPRPEHIDSQIVNALSPEEQLRSLRERLLRLDEKKKILAAVDSPCHDGMAWRKIGIDAFHILFENMSFPIVRNGGMVTLKFSDAEYKIALYHQFGPFNSNFNKSHGMQQMQRLLLVGQADIVCGAHHHVGETLKTWYGEGKLRKPVVYIRTGSYKGAFEPAQRDMWMLLRAGKTGEPGGQSVILFPQEKKMSTELELPLAMDIHGALMLQEHLKVAGILGNINQILT